MGDNLFGTDLSFVLELAHTAGAQLEKVLKCYPDPGIALKLVLHLSGVEWDFMLRYHNRSSEVISTE